ncbi:hypothetical protein [Paraburkholderia sp.]
MPAHLSASMAAVWLSISVVAAGSFATTGPLACWLARPRVKEKT